MKGKKLKAPKPATECAPTPAPQVEAAARLAQPSAPGLDTYLLLPWPPSVNHYWRKTPRGMMLSAAAKAFSDEALGLIATQRGVQGERWPLTGRLALRLVLHAPTRQARDVDNSVKGVQDVLTHAGVYLDDEQIDTLLVQRGNVMRGGCVQVSIVQLAPAPTDPDDD